MPWNEVSRRYVDEEPEFYFPEHWRAKADNVKQGSSETEAVTLAEDEYDPANPYASTHSARSTYIEMLKRGVAPEQARMVLPQNTMTEWIWSGTLGAYCDMLRLRLDNHTQYESRIVAELIYSKVEELYPVSVRALLG